MALTSWQGNIVRKQDIFIAKNYLNEDELDSLNRFVTVFLETAELRAKGRNDLTIKFWRENIDKIILLNDKELLTHNGSISNALMENKVTEIYEKFNVNRKNYDALQADIQDLEELKKLEQEIKLNAK
jgi:hypothetical protein